MVGTSVHHNLLLPQQHPHHTKPLEFTSTEQQCMSLLKHCKNIQQLKQTHCLIIKHGLHSRSFCTGNLLSTCALSTWGSMHYASLIFQQIDTPDSFEFNTMIRGYIMDMNLHEAVTLYTRMVEVGIRPNKFTYPSILKGCACLHRLEEGMQFHGHVVKNGVEKDVFVQNSLINMYGKCGNITESCYVFERMDCFDRSLASWSAIIAAHASKGMWSECISLFQQLTSQSCWRAEESVLVSVLSSCTNLGALDLGRSTHAFLIRNLSGMNVIVETCLLDMYLKCGSLVKGLTVFEQMKVKNQWSYSVVISGLAFHGYGAEALRVFSEMREKGIEPDEVVYVSVLTACSQTGQVEKGLEFFKKMTVDHKIEPTIQHYGCLVDLMGKAGKVKEAFDLIKNMPMEANDALWYSLLDACRIHQDIELGEKVAEKLLNMSSQTPSPYVILSNMYAKAGKWENVASARREMGQKGLTKTPGFSLIQVKRKVYKFVSNDVMWAHCKELSDMIYQMEWQLKFDGYSPDTSEVLLDVDEDEKRERLSKHSQKLALAFGLINTSHGSSVRIVRNMRMCKDCHTYTKYISSIFERRIIVRDRNRFHHFEDGNCSCKDYW
ncbi:putative tetratricopeptide-like helical domain superfamily, DYW domain-containing protein [Helianthus annuus]|uniref:Putative tetratricopeptide repeat (TPR)-like superfamily protein n=1 Tax=Helianthus annuus TaxID=4232 RepID=A0A251SS79_HELAN|nr:pentatricopeptide repeat-containing protein At1g31920 [Helianthus annuus]KAF5774439.1 putative tetratricopeptide-like helical domain superfamily, DYW domain-containing protein [Helianthus annuus]KAJ0477794.1 putative tetratricopeptide-like helical domain superfamily, DYW domain-containing protein [Helianthus annuus]KAJ0482372.1 putative tetratricopeptide-like helical domain superfamily, DYW domain-containing protein [Helianthus annuus]KAJ0498626.1 putative tetratricopeptide-like helical doma